MTRKHSGPLWHLLQLSPFPAHSLLNEDQGPSKNVTEGGGVLMLIESPHVPGTVSDRDGSVNPHDNPMKQVLLYPIVWMGKLRPKDYLLKYLG